MLLGHNDLIKVCKILLHKFNIAQERSKRDYQEVKKQTSTDLQNSELAYKSNLEEVNLSVQNILQSFEAFSKRITNKSKKDQELVTASLKKAEYVNKLVELLAHSHTCLLEYNRIGSHLLL